MRTGVVKFAALLAAVVVVQVGLGGPVLAAKGKTLREAYVGDITSNFSFPTGPTGFCRADPSNPTGKNVGKVCFTGLTSPGKYKVTVVDASGQDVGFTYKWDYGAVTGHACKTVTLTKPPRTAWGELRIYLDGPIVVGSGFGLGECCIPLFPSWNPHLPDCLFSELSPGFATTGEVVLTKPAR